MKRLIVLITAILLYLGVNGQSVVTLESYSTEYATVNRYTNLASNWSDPIRSTSSIRVTNETITFSDENERKIYTLTQKLMSDKNDSGTLELYLGVDEQGKGWNIGLVKYNTGKYEITLSSHGRLKRYSCKEIK